MGEIYCHSGEISIDRNKKFVGEIRDPNSLCKKHAVKGEISIDDERIRIDFLKIPTGILVPVKYSLKCQNSFRGTLEELTDEDLRGIYDGIWVFTEEAIIPKKLLIKCEPGAVTAMTEVMRPEQENYALLRLYK